MIWNTTTAVIGAFIAVAVTTAVPKIKEAFSPPWAEFVQVDAQDGPYKPGDRLSVRYLFTKSKDCQATAHWLFIDEKGAHMKDHRGAVPASINQFNPSENTQIMTVLFGVPDLDPGRYGYRVTIVPDNEVCGARLHPDAAWFTVE